MLFAWIALAVLFLATWTTFVINLYSTALAARASIELGDYRLMVVVLGVVGTFAALVGISDNLIDFLIVMGLLVPPIAGVYLTDFFALGRQDFSEAKLARRSALRVNALIVVLAAGALASWLRSQNASLTSVGAVDSLLLAAIGYYSLEKLLGRGARLSST